MYRAVCNDAVIGEFDDFKPAFDTVLNFAIGKIGDRDFKGVSVQIDNKKAFEIDFMGDEYVCGVPVESTEDIYLAENFIPYSTVKNLSIN